MALVNYKSDSINSLITKLAKTFAPDEYDRCRAADVAKLRMQIFEKVLRYSNASQCQPPMPCMDEELLCQLFICKLWSRQNELASRRKDVLLKLEKLIETERAIFDTDLGNNMGYMLLCITEVHIANTIEPQPVHEMLIPEPLRLTSHYKSDGWDVLQHVKPLTLKKPSVFGDIKFLHSHNVDDKLEPTGERIFKLSDETGISCNIFKPFKYFKETFARIVESNEPPNRQTPRLPTVQCAQVKPKTNSKKKRQRLGEHQKRFISDLNLSNTIRFHNDTKIGKNPVLFVLSISDLICHLKKAAVGVQSETFMCDENGDFFLKPNVTLETVIPEVLEEFVKPFLESGSCFLRLAERTKWHKVANCIELPLNRSLRLALDKCLTNCRDFMISQSCDQLPQLIINSRTTMNLIRNLDFLFTSNCAVNLPEGTDGVTLLSCFWSEVDKCVNLEFAQTLLYFLHTLCETYFGQLQEWIYHGDLGGECNELFIDDNSDKYNKLSKEFFDKAFIVRPGAVPPFLIDYEQEILQCGRYNMLLRSYNRQHDFFKLKCADIVVCFTEEQLMQLRQNVEQRYNLFLQLHKPFTIADMFAEKSASKDRFANCSRESTQAYITAWEQQQREELEMQNIRKQDMYAAVNAAKEEELQQKLERRKMDIVLELQLKKEVEDLELKRLERNKKELQEQIGIIQEAIGITGNSEPTLTPPTDSLHVQLNRSHSDMLNSNELVEPQIKLNRTLSDVLNSNEEVTTTTQIVVQTDVQRNRQRVLNCTEIQVPTDVNLNAVATDLTDLQRNRQRMMHHDNFSQINKTQYDDLIHAKRNLDAESPLERNRRHVLESEYGIQLGNSLTLPLAEKEILNANDDALVSTPMSTTSDADLISAATISEAGRTEGHDEIMKDALNNNRNSNMTAAIEDSNEDLELEEIQSKLFEQLVAKCIKENKIEEEIVGENLLQITLARNDCQLPPTHDQGFNPSILKRYLQYSVMVPLRAHFHLLRNEVLSIFLKDLRVYDQLREMRNFFFLLDGEFGSMLAGGILNRIEEGMQPRSLCHKGVLDEIFNNSLSPSSSSIEFITQNFTLNCQSIPDSFDLISLDTLSIFKLDYKVKWPLNLVISNETISKYAQVFSHLLKLRHVVFMLERAYNYIQQKAKQYGVGLRDSPQFRHLQMIRHKLMHFVTTLQSHLSLTALLSPWKTFKEKLRTVNSVEGLYQQHVAYLKRITFLALLNRHSIKFQEAINSVLVISLRFCKVLQSQDFIMGNENYFIHPRYKRLMFEEAEFDKFMIYIIYLGNKVATSGYQEEMSDLIRVINFNNYYNLA